MAGKKKWVTPTPKREGWGKDFSALGSWDSMAVQEARSLRTAGANDNEIAAYLTTRRGFTKKPDGTWKRPSAATHIASTAKLGLKGIGAGLGGKFNQEESWLKMHRAAKKKRWAFPKGKKKGK